MDSLFVIQPGTYLAKDGNTLKIMRGREVVEVIPASELTQIFLAGRTSISGQVLDFLIRKKIDTIFLTLDGRFRARLLLDEAGHVALRMAQYARLGEEDYQLATGAAIVREKLENQARLLLRRGSQLQLTELRAVATQIKALKGRLASAKNMDEIRGVEGYGTRLYYGVFGMLIRNDSFSFTGRNRRPPRDPVNGMLSFVYTLFTNEVLNGLQSAGLDPYLGSLHSVLSGRPSLACDLVEEWRVFAERLVLTLINRKVVEPADFLYRPEANGKDGLLPVEMKPDMMKSLIAGYRKQLETKTMYPPADKQLTLRWIIHSQCRHFGECLMENRPYEPFIMRR